MADLPSRSADERFGERVGAVVQLGAEIAAPDADDLREHCRATLAGYKVPAQIEFVPHVVRSPTGKADYRWARATLPAARDAAVTPGTSGRATTS